jgi:hypothetical protein
MTTDDTGQNDPSIRPVPKYGEQSQDALLGQSRGDKPELDTYGLPVQDRPPKGRKSAGGSGGAIVVAERIPRWEAIIATVFCWSR